MDIEGNGRHAAIINSLAEALQKNDTTMWRKQEGQGILVACRFKCCGDMEELYIQKIIAQVFSRILRNPLCLILIWCWRRLGKTYKKKMGYNIQQHAKSILLK
jgi:hypothetical protein